MSKLRQWCLAIPDFTKMIPDHLAVNDTTYTVTQFHLQLGRHIGFEDTRFRNVPNGCSLYYVLNDKLLSGLVLGHASGTVGATSKLLKAAALLGTTIVASLFGHLGSKELRAPVGGFFRGIFDGC